MKSTGRKKPHGGITPVKVRPMIAALLVLVLLISAPLLIVWQQAFITGASMKLEKMSDTLSIMNREIAGLRMQRERLSDNERVEAIARSSLALDYPSSDRITVVESPPGCSAKMPGDLTGGLFSARSDQGNKGGGE
jgi:cell division protein FtsL